MLREIIKGIRITLVLCLLTGVIYPLVMLAIGLILPYQANGSLITNPQGQVVGSALIGQNFTSDRYFWGRPSTTSYNQGKDAPTTGSSGASNFAPSNPDLLKRITEDQQKWQTSGVKATADLLYTSGSSLDPHITVAAAKAQVERVAKARAITPDKLESVIAQNTEGRFLGIFGDPGVNVLKLNLSLDQA